MEYKSEIVGRPDVVLFKSGKVMCLHSAAEELNRYRYALEQIKLYHENMYGAKAKDFIAYVIACGALSNE